MYEATVKAIVKRYGGFREMDIMSRSHTIQQGSTWNKEHKVLEVLAKTPDADGYFPGFQVDIVTWFICG